ncbi:MAG: hypothetical protein NTV88_02050 [Candidatus Micrarchaeota archaeon]|nr:hypothetical protein [Candidatus Micrarchaeota archaeon]
MADPLLRKKPPVVIDGEKEVPSKPATQPADSGFYTSTNNSKSKSVPDSKSLNEAAAKKSSPVVRINDQSEERGFEKWGYEWFLLFGSVNKNNEYGYANVYSDYVELISPEPFRGTYSVYVKGPEIQEGNLDFSVTAKTVEQLRQNKKPNPWEVNWVVWNRTYAGTDEEYEHEANKENFYYFYMQPGGGWVLGKEINGTNYELVSSNTRNGGNCIVSSGSDVKKDYFDFGPDPSGQYEVPLKKSDGVQADEKSGIKVFKRKINGSISDWHDFNIMQNSNTDGSVTIAVSVNGEKVVEFIDRDNPYKSGNIMLYNEDCIAQMKDLKINEN